MNTPYSFKDDYSEGCHPAILDALARHNTQQLATYGEDSHSQKARQLISQACGNTSLSVFLVSSGTQANLISIAATLRPHEAVIAATTGHIAVHEAGAIEATGHKVITVATSDGKLTPDLISDTLAANAHFPHMAKPRLVYISNATELGTVYTKAELEAIRNTCNSHALLLLIDGARLGAALTSGMQEHTLSPSLPDIAALADIFWIGGTKTGALLGEAVVIPNKAIAQDYPFHLKQRGALLAKGRLLGIQFTTLFQNGLYFDLASHANTMAKQLSEGVTQAGYTLSAQTQSNQVFPILPNELIDTLDEQFVFYRWRNLDDSQAIVRLVTSWATPQAAVERFVAALPTLSSTG